LDVGYPLVMHIYAQSYLKNDISKKSTCSNTNHHINLFTPNCNLKTKKQKRGKRKPEKTKKENTCREKASEYGTAFYDSIFNHLILHYVTLLPSSPLIFCSSSLFFSFSSLISNKSFNTSFCKDLYSLRK
jgi:hypothetical protein